MVNTRKRTYDNTQEPIYNPPGLSNIAQDVKVDDDDDDDDDGQIYLKRPKMDTDTISTVPLTDTQTSSQPTDFSQEPEELIPPSPFKTANTSPISSQNSDYFQTANTSPISSQKLDSIGSINIDEVKQQIFDWFGGKENCNKTFVVKNNKNESDYLGLECIKDDNGVVVDFDIRDKTGTPIIKAHPNLIKDSTPLVDYFKRLLPPPVPVEFDSATFTTPITDVSSLQQKQFYPIQFSNNILDTIDDIFDTFNTALKIREVYIDTKIDDKIKLNLPAITEDKPSSLISFIQKIPNQDKQKKMNTVMLCFSFIRSYIDFYHDFEYLAFSQLQIIKSTLFNQSVIFKNIKDYIIFDGIKIGDFLKQTLDYIDNQVISSTGSGNINQTTCKKLLKGYMEKYCQIMISLGVYWLTPNKETAFMYSTKTCNIKKTNNCTEVDNNIDKLVEKLREDGIELFYTEMDKSHISELLVIRGLNMVSSLSGLRDAGSGYSFKTAQKINTKLINSNIYRNYDENSQNNILVQQKSGTFDYIITNSEQYLSTRFLFLDLFNIVVDINEKSNNLYLNNIDRSSVKLVSNNSEIEQLSLNSVLQTVNMRQMRGKGRADALKKINIENPTDVCRTGILALKTFTDFIQLLDVHDIKDVGLYPVFITLDMLCEDSGMLFGLPTIKSESSYVSYYCYDTRYHSIDPILMQRKLNVFLRIVSNTDKIKDQIINGIFGPIRNYINILIKYHFNPCIYYASSFLLKEIDVMERTALEKIEEIENKYDEFNENFGQVIDINYLKLIPHDTDAFNEWKLNLQGENITPEILLGFNGDLNLFMEQLCNFSNIKGTFINTSQLFMEQFDIIREIDSRSSKDDFKNLYYNIKQELINFLPKDSNKEEINFNIFLIFLMAFSTSQKQKKVAFLFLTDIFIEDKMTLREIEDQKEPVGQEDKVIMTAVKNNVAKLDTLTEQFIQMGQTVPIIQNYIDVFTATHSANEDPSIFKPIPYSLIYELMRNLIDNTNTPVNTTMKEHFDITGGRRRKNHTRKLKSKTHKKRAHKKAPKRQTKRPVKRLPNRSRKARKPLKTK
jgi:hypothetical protein